MKRLALLMLVFVLSLSDGDTTLATNTTLDIAPDKGFYRPGETVTLQVTASEGVRVEATIMSLAEAVDTVQADLVDGVADLTWTPPSDSPRGYGWTRACWTVRETCWPRLQPPSTCWNAGRKRPAYGF